MDEVVGIGDGMVGLGNEVGVRRLRFTGKARVRKEERFVLVPMSTGGGGAKI